MLCLIAVAVFGAVDGFKALVILGGSVGVKISHRYEGLFFAVGLGEEVNGCIFKAAEFYAPSVFKVGWGCFVGRDYAPLLFYKESAFPMLTAGEAVGRSRRPEE